MGPMKPAVVALTLSIGLDASPTASLQGRPDSEPFTLLGQWLSAVERHEPGEADTPLLAAAAWSGSDLREIWFDVQVLIDIVGNPSHTRFRVEAPAYEKTPGGRNAMTLTFRPAERAILDRFATRVRDAGADVVLRRAVLLHTDSIVLAGEVVAASGGPRSSRAPVKLLVGDGNSAGQENVSVHWELARLAAASVTPGPTGDQFVRDWYRATIALEQRYQSFDADQLREGLRLFPNDAQLLLLAGCEREAFASPLFQAFARSVTGRFRRVPIGSEGSELEAAERYYRRAFGSDPALVEARVRLGRVLSRRGRAAEAATELQRAVDDGLDPELAYFALIFLAEVRETLGQLDAAEAAYRRAADLTPEARVPHLQLARLARERGDPDTAQASLQRALATPGDDSVEPWLTYRGIQGRQADRWLDEVRRGWGDRTP